MPSVTSGAASLEYEAAGPVDAPACLLLHSLGTTRELWEPQWSVRVKRYRGMRYDVRGHGGSQPPVGPYTLEQLGRDALAVLDAAGAEQAHVCGVSLGGLTAQWLGRHAPDRVDRLVAANTGARLGSAEGWSARIAEVREGGIEAVVEGGLTRWFTPRFRTTDPETTERFRQMLRRCSVEGYAGACAVLRDGDLRPELGQISAQTLVVTGTHDAATPPALGEAIADGVPNGHLVELDAAHLSNVEQASAFTGAVERFLSQ